MTDAPSQPPPPRRSPPLRALWRLLDVLDERIGVRPLGLLVFAASIVLLVALRLSGAQGPIKAPAVAHAPSIEHPSRIDSVVAEVHVAPGELVLAGTPLVSLSPQLAERELRALSAEIVRYETLAELEQTREARDRDLYIDELERQLDEARLALIEANSEATLARELARAAERQRLTITEHVGARTRSADDLPEVEFEHDAESARASDARRRASAARDHLETLEQRLAAARDAPTLSAALTRQFAAEIELLRVQQRALRDDLTRTTVVATHSGRIVSVAAPGQAAPPGASVATLVPERATEIVAYVPPDTPPTRIVVGAEVAIVRPDAACGGAQGRVLRRGGAVQEAPGQVRGLLPLPVHGTPVYVSVPEDCELGVGQLLEVELGTVTR